MTVDAAEMFDACQHRAVGLAEKYLADFGLDLTPVEREGFNVGLEVGITGALTLLEERGWLRAP